MKYPVGLLRLGEECSSLGALGMGACERADKGAALLEAAIILPWVILVLVLMIDIGRMMHTYAVLNQIVNDSLHYGASFRSENISAPENMTLDKRLKDVVEEVRGRAVQLIERDSRLRGKIRTIDRDSDIYAFVTGTADRPMITLSITAEYEPFFPFNPRGERALTRMVTRESSPYRLRLM